jgi:hypothetical protein
VAARSKEAHELAWVANGYLQSALYLAEKMREEDTTNDPYHRRVPLYLCHHALEVLYKAALVDEGRRCPLTHDLAKLRAECVASISDTDFPVPTWLIDTTPRTASLFPDLPVMYFENLYERVRYASDTKGRRLPPFPDLDLGEVIDNIFELKKASSPLFLRLAWNLEKNERTGTSVTE